MSHSYGAQTKNSGIEILLMTSNQTEYRIDNIELSLVIPAYNEESRLPLMIESTVNYFTKEKQVKFEIIIVNDGSKDNTAKVIEDIMKKHNTLEISYVTYKNNSGKGYAVTTGMKYARGEFILMLDADGATGIRDYEKLKMIMDSLRPNEQANGALVIGSRNQATPNLQAKREWYRNIPMLVNNFIVRQLIGIKHIKDTQCGFKLFSRKAAKRIIFNLHLIRWAFDVEMLYIAQHFKIPVREIPVSFEDVPGSKLNVFCATVSFFRDYFAMFTFYNTGYWNIIDV